MTHRIRARGRVAAWLLLMFVGAGAISGEAGAGIPGDTFDDAFSVPGLPLLATGSTCGFGDDAVTICGPHPPGAPDVVYRYVPDHDMTVTISMCGSAFWGSVSVYDASRTRLVCDSGNCLKGGYIGQLSLVGGSPYYVVIDGEGGFCGEYILSIDECAGTCEPVYVRCPPGAIQEGENSCLPGYVDDFNGCSLAGGCHATTVPCTGSEVTVCGTHGWNSSAEAPHDVDFYEFELATASMVTITMSGRTTLEWQLSRLPTGADPGEDLGYWQTTHGIAFNGVLLPGRYRLWLVLYMRARVACGSKYLIQFSGLNCTPTSAQRSSWGALKVAYR